MAPRKAPAKRTAAAKPKPPARGRTRRPAKTAAPRRAPRTQAPAARARRPKAKAGTPSAKPRLLRVDVVEKNREAAPIAPSAVPASRARRPLPQRSAEGAGATSTFVQLFTRDPDSLLVFWQASAQAVATLLGEMGSARSRWRGQPCASPTSAACTPSSCCCPPRRARARCASTRDVRPTASSMASRCRRANSGVSPRALSSVRRRRRLASASQAPRRVCRRRAHRSASPNRGAASNRRSAPETGRVLIRSPRTRVSKWWRSSIGARRQRAARAKLR